MYSRIESYNSLIEALLDAPAEQPFVTDYDPSRSRPYQTLTFGQFRDQSLAVGAQLQLQGVGDSDRIALILPQNAQLMSAFAGALLIGAIPTILAYPTFKIDPGKYRHGLSGVARNIRPALILVDETFPRSLQRMLSEAGDCPILVLGDVFPKGNPPGVYQAVSDEIAFLQHSAGTTGLQKGVALPHRSVLNQIKRLVQAMNLSEQDRIVSWLPLYHDMGLIACFMLPVVCHLQLVMQSPTEWVLHPGSFLELITRFRCTLAWMPNFAFQFLARRVPEEERSQYDLSSMRLFVSTSEPIRDQSQREFLEAFQSCGLSQVSLQTSYGMAENTFAVTQSLVDGTSLPTRLTLSAPMLAREGRVQICTKADPEAQTLVSCGRCMPSNRVRIMKGEQELEEGRVGELVVTSDSLFEGYYNRPDLTRRVLHEGWYRTGDIGFLWKGDVFVIGRQDDMIIVGGQNIFPEDVELIACRHPDVHDGRAVALGLFNEELGTQDLVIIVEVHKRDLLRHQKRIAADIRKDVTAEIGITPRLVHPVEPRWLVKSTAGKPARSSNREKLLKQLPRLSGGPK